MPANPSTRRYPGRWLLAAMVVLLVGAIGMQLLYRLQEVAQPAGRVRLAESLPRQLAGWSVADEALGQTEAVSEAALKVLNLDDYVYRRFTKGSVSFTVYAAYWAQGKMPTRLVASHTPDRCWTENGMRCVDQRFRHVYHVGDQDLLPAEFRVFTPGGMNAGTEDGAPKTYVAYWHTVEGKIYDYGARFNAVPSPWLWWKDTMAQAAYGSREQMFVRIASGTPFESLWANQDFLAVMKEVGALGLWAASE